VSGNVDPTAARDALAVDTLNPTPLPSDRPAVVATSPGDWVRKNLFSSVFNSILTVIFGALLGWLLYSVARFVVQSDWTIIDVNLTNFLVGRFPREFIPSLWAGLYWVALTIGLVAGVAGKSKPRTTSWQGLLGRFGPPVALLVVLLLFTDGVLPIALSLGVLATVVVGYAVGYRLPRVIARRIWIVAIVGLVIAYVVASAPTDGYTVWGGLLLTVFLAMGAIALSFPIGVLLALGRRSTLPAVRVVSVGYIELIRGVPLITLLFMGAFMLGFFYPDFIPKPGKITSALIAMILFTAAYVAEIVRGGLQSVPRGQVEAARAIGLSPTKTTRLIVLPQALRAVIPALIGQFISMFKDTSLVSILGLLELLGVARVVTQQPDFLAQGLDDQTLAFAAFIYWVFCYSMSRASQRLEQRLEVGQR
jgi:general L-amino acid transport system permease protein